MCGLVGIIAKNQSGFFAGDRDAFAQMLYADVLRGSDATGVFGVKKNGNLDILKQATPAGWFLASKQFQFDFGPKIIQEYQIVIGHNRKATHGDRKDQDAHPFYNEPICLVHNGMISNHKELCKESTVDSNAVCNAFAKGDFKEILKDIEGAYAFIWYNVKDKTLYFIRNDKRPLFIVETNTTYILVSEKELAEWICKRNNHSIKGIQECVPHTLYSFDITTRELKEEKLNLTKVSQSFRPGFPHNSCNEVTVYRPTSRSNVRSLMGAYSVLDSQPLLITDKDFALVNGIPQVDPDFLIERGHKIIFEVEELEDHTAPNFTGNLVRVQGAILNCPKTPVTVVGYVPVKDLKDIAENFVAMGDVNRVETYKNKWTIYVTNTEYCDPVIKSANDYWITNEMWMHEDFGSRCTSCGEKVVFEELTAWDVEIDPDNTTVVCPKCIEKRNQACINE